MVIMDITPKALKQIISIRENWNDLLRVKVVGGGCSGMSYHMDWAKDFNEHDKFRAYELSDSTEKPLHVIIDSKSSLFLKDVVLDFEDGLNGKGFIWSNSSAKGTCGCGISFSV